LKQNKFYEYSQQIVTKLENTCTTPDKSHHYKSVVKELDQCMSTEQLSALKELVIDDELKGLWELNDIGGIIQMYGKLDIVHDPDNFDQIDVKELRKLFAVSKLRFHQMLLNLHLDTLTNSQWNIISTLMKPLVAE